MANVNDEFRMTNDEDRKKSKFENRNSKFAPRAALGFTLIEILIAIGLLSLTIGLLWTIGRDAMEAASIENSRQIVLDETARTINEITRHIQGATHIVASYTHPDTGEVTTSSATSLVLKLPAYDTTGIHLSSFDTIVIKPDPQIPTSLIIQTVPAPSSRRQPQTRRPSQLLTNLSFHYFIPIDIETSNTSDYPSVTRIVVNLTNQIIDKNRTIEASYAGGGTLRNRVIGN